jgi:secondary thiamine-phosphate synthase enzyme
MVFGKELVFATEGFSSIDDITGEVQAVVAASRMTNGTVTVFVIGSTASISTVEYEPALVTDLQDTLENFLSRSLATRHGKTWGDDNGFSHLRATMMGPGITLPFQNGELVLGTWQQIILIDHDNRPRSRRVFIQIIGE